MKAIRVDDDVYEAIRKHRDQLRPAVTTISEALRNLIQLREMQRRQGNQP